ncbi:MAG: hypothetical protein RIQ47_965 [Bacteroidota bacterium]|jgi:hypothetical protein
MKRLLLAFLLSIAFVSNAQIKILFDASSAQMAGNADWVVDADLYNIGTGTGGVMTAGRGNEANPQRIPTAAQSGITATTAETYWKGALSNWGIDLVRRGYTIETLPFNGLITYGVSTNAQDLSNYKVFIVIEPNIAFTAAEKTAMMNFVQNGGGLFIGGNHAGSDRNSDGWDPVRVWNDFFRNNGVRANPFGINFDSVSYSQTSYNIAPLTTNAILKGPAGNVTGLKYDAGASMTLNPVSNTSVTGLVYKTGASNTGTTQVMFASATYGNGRVCGIADSSPSDDGTGDRNDVLYTGYRTAVSGSHQKLLINAILWLAGTTSFASPTNDEPQVYQRQIATETEWSLFPNPASDRVTISGSFTDETVYISLRDMTGRELLSQTLIADNGRLNLDVDRTRFPQGIYLLTIINGDQRKSLRLILN